MTDGHDQAAADRRRACCTIRGDEAGQPLGDWLPRRFTYHSRETWHQLLAEGRVLVNGTVGDAAHCLAVNEVVEYLIPERAEPPVDATVTVVFEDPELLVINKSGDLPCHPAGRFFRHTLWYWLREHYAPFWIINRLDRETSGLVVVARTRRAAGRLGTALARRHLRRTYLAVVEGVFPEQAAAVGYLSPDPTSVVRKKRRFTFAPVADAEPAETHFVRLAVHDGLSLVQCQPATGRLHQLRATLLALGYPLIGDKLYGVDETLYLRFAHEELTAADRERLRLPRQALHAWQLTLEPPAHPTPLTIVAPLPSDLADFLRQHGFPNLTPPA